LEGKIMYGFDDKIALVVGAASGIGRGVALRLVQEGALVACADLDMAGVQETVSMIEKKGGKAKGFAVHLQDVSTISSMVDEVADTYKKIDMLVNVAGVCQSKPFIEVTEKEWDFIIDINQKGTTFCMQAVARKMLEHVPQEVKKNGKTDTCYGKIVNFSSISGRRGRELQIHYASSKAAIISLTQSAALALAPFGINVNAVSPSVVKTPMWEKNVKEKSIAFNQDVLEENKRFIARIPLQREGSVEEMANAVAFLCSDQSNYITGQTLNVDGGFEMD